MDNDILNQLQKFLQENPERFSIIEEKIDINLQMEYFKISKKIKETIDEDYIMNNYNILFEENTNFEAKRDMLISLASLENVEAFRTIEKFNNETNDVELKKWASLALRESKMMLETSLLDQKQVLISTGLGGKDGKLRYFIVLINNNDEEFSDTQKKVIKNEFDIAFYKNNSEIENMNFEDKYSKITSLIPLNVQIKDTLQNAVEECNMYGNFLSPNFIVTNVKELSNEEIDTFLVESKKEDKTLPPF